VVVLRCTAKLLARVGPAVADPGQSAARLGDWYAKPFPVAQRRFILLMSGPARLPVVLPGSVAAGLARDFPDVLAGVLARLGVPAKTAAAEIDASREVVIAATDSRSMLGSLNDFASLAQHHLRCDPGVDLMDLSVDLSETPVIALGFESPYEAVRRLLA
jgi:hypothetical protein